MSNQYIIYNFRAKIQGNVSRIKAAVNCHINPLTGTLKPQSNGALYSNTVIGTLAVDE